MPKKKTTTKSKDAAKRSPGMSDAAVQAKTGKTWNEWFKILDAAKMKGRLHAEIASYLYEKLKLDGWWAQMVTVGYERARGMRELHQKAEGYEISVSKTLGVPVTKLFEAWNDPRTRAEWLAESGFTITKATPSKSMRISWNDGKTRVSVNFYPKGDAKSQVTLQHMKLASAKEVGKRKAFWMHALERLRRAIEG